MSTQALQTTSQPNSLAKVDLKELETLSTWAVKSGMFPDLQSYAQAGMKILAGKELGFEPIVSLTGIHFFNGKVVLGATLLASLVKDSGKYEYKVLKHTDQECHIQFMKLFDGKWQPMGVPVVYTIKDASNAQLTGKDVWKKHPADMLFATCIRKGTRRYCADLLRGMNAPAGDYEERYEAQVASQEITDGLADYQQPAETPQETAQFSDESAIEAEIVEDTDEFVTAAELTELRESATELVSNITGGDEKEVKKILKGRVIGAMQAQPLRNLIAELKAI